jgi:hypothetical protein
MGGKEEGKTWDNEEAVGVDTKRRSGLLSRHTGLVPNYRGTLNLKLTLLETARPFQGPYVGGAPTVS